jgi:F0F1-type ATP synthase assembly protein I
VAGQPGMTWLFCCPDDSREAVSNRDLQSGRRQALAVLASQLLLGVIVAIACLAVGGVRAGASALLGAGIGAAATSLMAFAMLRPGEGASLTRVTLGFFSGWLVKVGFTVAVMVMAFRSQKVDAVPLLAAYVATFAGYWFGAVRASGQATKNHEKGRSG